MSALGDHLDDYLRLRRALGFQLGRHGESLPGFVAFLDANGAATITVEMAVAWARLPERIKPITVDFRISAVRGFARYLHALDPAHQIPPAGLLSVPRRRPTPYIYTPDEVVDVLAAARRLRPPLRAATQTALLGLLAATGMRSGEAMALSRADVNLVEGLITVRHAKFDRMRLVPLHPSVTGELRDYATTRDRLCRTPSVDRFFVSVTGRALHRRETDTTAPSGGRGLTIGATAEEVDNGTAGHADAPADPIARKAVLAAGGEPPVGEVVDGRPTDPEEGGDLGDGERQGERPHPLDLSFGCHRPSSYARVVWSVKGARRGAGTPADGMALDATGRHRPDKCSRVGNMARRRSVVRNHPGSTVRRWTTQAEAPPRSPSGLGSWAGT